MSFDMLDDFRTASRSLKSTPTFTIVALLVLTLGIGASTAVFSVVDAIVLRGLPFDEHDRLMAVGERRKPAADAVIAPNQDPAAVQSAAPQNYLDWSARQQTFESMAAIANGAWRSRRTGCRRAVVSKLPPAVGDISES